MADVVTPEVRSRMMAGIRAKNTRPEILIRRGLFKRGLRFRIHDPRFPGKPDIVLPKHRAVVLVHGCFWHGHSCPLFKWPATRGAFWLKKIERNQVVDARSRRRLRAAGWRVLTIWECAMKGRGRLSTEEIVDQAAKWVLSVSSSKEIRGIKARENGRRKRKQTST
jgi:DNA mismatch endonuclease (patch repair protein)